MNAPVTLAGAKPPLDEVVAAFRAAAENTVKVMPPLAAAALRREILAVAKTVATGVDGVEFLVAHWAERVDEINAYAARSSERVEVEAFVDGTDPADADWTARFDTDAPAEALAANWRADAGVAHRSTIYLHGPWVIDRPARNGAAA